MTYEEIKQAILNKDYTLQLETEQGCSFYNNAVEFCVIILKEYTMENHYKEFRELFEDLQKKIAYTKKTIAIILNTDYEKEEVRRDEYYFMKIFEDQIDSIPVKKNEITINIVPMEDINDNGDYLIDPLELYDSIAVIKLVEFVISAKDNCVIKYPRGMEKNVMHVRYIVNKMVNKVNYTK
jgi:hypothetical protein